jgi:hypothetical protein
MSIFDGTREISTPLSWRCPHCRTLQAESSRCWRCSRSAINCSSCGHFRRAVVSDLGYCAMQRTRTPLGGEEVRSCWEPPQPVSSPAGLFAGLDEIEAVEPADPAPPSPATTARPAGTRPSRSPLLSLEAAAWREPSSGALVEAPRIEPRGRLISEITRRLSTGD